MMSHSEELDEIDRSAVAQLSVKTPMSFISPRLLMQALSYLTSSREEGEHSATRYFKRKGPRSYNLYYSILLYFFYFISHYY